MAQKQVVVSKENLKLVLLESAKVVERLEKEIAHHQWLLQKAIRVLQEVQEAMKDRDDVVFEDMIEKIEDFLNP